MSERYFSKISPILLNALLILITVAFACIFATILEAVVIILLKIQPSTTYSLILGVYVIAKGFTGALFLSFTLRRMIRSLKPGAQNGEANRIEILFVSDKKLLLMSLLTGYGFSSILSWIFLNILPFISQ